VSITGQTWVPVDVTFKTGKSWGPTLRLASESPLLVVVLVQARRIALGDRTSTPVVLANLSSDRYRPGSP
jgi:hypothetical protein